MSQIHPIETLNVTTNNIFKLKEFFKEEINSNRRFEEISTLQELYMVLEDRDALTDEILLKVEPNFKNFVHSQRTGNKSKELIIPQSVVRLLQRDFSGDWKTLGVNLKLSKEQINECHNLEDILMKFKENCNGVSPQEITFRLNRGLEKCGKGGLKFKISELMETDNL